MTGHPSPRPALRKAADASVHPAAPRLAGPAEPLDERDEKGGADGRAKAPAGRRAKGATRTATKTATKGGAKAETATKTATKGGAKGGAKAEVAGGPDLALAPPPPARTGRDERGVPPVLPSGPLPKAGGKTVELAVPMPKSMRKRLRAKAAEHGFTAEEAAFHLVRLWLDG